MEKSFDKAGDSREIRNISDAVINLYAAHVHSLLYPYDNPLITDSLRNAFQCLQKAFRKKPQIQLEIADGKLMINGEPLEGDVLVLNNFAAWLNSRGIKSLSLSDGVTRRELVSFHKIISMQKLSGEELHRTMSGKSIINIAVHMTERQGDRPPEKCMLGDAAGREFVGEYVGTMFHAERGQEQTPFYNGPPEGAAAEGLSDKGPEEEFVSTMFQIGTRQYMSFFADSPAEQASVGERPAEDLHQRHVEMLIERNDLSDDEKKAIALIPPERMADLLNAMFLVTPGEDILIRVASAYLGGEGALSGELDFDRQKIFFERLKPDLRQSLQIICASLLDFGLQSADSDSSRQDSPELFSTGYSRGETPAPPPAVVQRTLEGSDFVFDFIACGKAVLHDIEIEGDTADLFGKTDLEHPKGAATLDMLSSGIAARGGGGAAVLIDECADDMIMTVSFGVVLELLDEQSLDIDAYHRLGPHLRSLVEFSLEKGDFERVLDVFNTLKTQSLQGGHDLQASSMIRSVFLTDQFSGKVVDALIRHGRKQRERAVKLTRALRSYLVPYLLEALGEERDTSSRKFMISLLTSLEGDVLQHIVKRLRDSRWYVLRNMLYLLRECHGRSYGPELKDFLEHEVPLVRLEALRTLLSFQDPEADACVKKFLKSDIFQLQKGAVWLAGAYRIKSAVPNLIRLLKEKDILGKKFLFKKAIVSALGRIGDGQAVSHLLLICRSSSVVHKSDIDRLKAEIFRTLHNYPVTTVGPLLGYGLESGNKEITAICRKLASRYNLPASGRK